MNQQISNYQLLIGQNNSIVNIKLSDGRIIRFENLSFEKFNAIDLLLQEAPAFFNTTTGVFQQVQNLWIDKIGRI